LALFGGAPADLLAVKDAALKVDKRTALFRVRRGSRYRARPCAGVDPNQDKARDVA
jgi:hypothetical protein